MKYTEKDLLNMGLHAPPITPEKLQEWIDLALELSPEVGFLFFEWDQAPAELQELCSANGGDEDLLILTKGQKEIPYWLERMLVYRDPDIYTLEQVTLYVISHG
jgi:hypothetical protein